MTPEFGPPQVTVALDAASPEGWDDLVLSDPHSDFFHTAAWTLLAAEHVPGLAPFWLTVRDEGGLVAGLAGLRRAGGVRWRPRVDRWESSYEGASGGPVIRGDLADGRRQELFDLLLRSLVAQGSGLLRRWSVSLNTGHEQVHGARLDNSWHRRSVPGGVISLEDGLEAFEMSRMKKNKRNERNRGIKRGIKAFVTSEARWLRAYYPLYEAASAAWGVTPTPLAFLEGLLDLGPERSFFTCVVKEDEVVGGHLILVHGRRALAWNGVTDPGLARTHFPATIAVWQDAVEACERGLQCLDLGASGGIVSLEGFKKHFGAELEERGFYVRQSNLMAGVSRLRGGSEARGSARRWHDGQERS